MSSLLTLALLFVPHTGPRSFQDIQADLRAALRDEVAAKTDVERSLAVVRLVRVYGELVRDSRFATSETLQKYKTRVTVRLAKVKADIQRRQSWAHRRTRRESRSAGQENPIARGGRAGAGDYGPALVALIERTISPEFWDVHGGPGTIVYYRPLRVLVVRATDDVHGRVGDALDGLGR